MSESYPQESNYYSIENITMIVCVRLTEHNPWIVDRLALYSQWFIPCPQVLVIDYGSKHSYATALSELCRKHHYRYHHEDNKGIFSLSESRNIGFTQSETDFVFFTDPDFTFERNIFQRLLRTANALDLHQNYLTRITMPAYHLSPSHSKLFEDSKIALYEKENKLIQWMYHGVYTEYNQIFEYIAPYSNNFFCHRHFYDLVGGYSTDFIGHGSEDFEFLIRLNLLKNELPLPIDITKDMYKPSELDYKTQEYEGFRRLAELEAFAAEVHGFRSFHLWHPRQASKGWYENNDRKRKVFNTVLSRYIKQQICLLETDYLPRSKKALCIVSSNSKLIDFLALRLEGYALDVLASTSRMEENIDLINTQTYETIIFHDEKTKETYLQLTNKIKNNTKVTLLMELPQTLKKKTTSNNLAKAYKYSNNSYAARRLNINTQKSVNQYICSANKSLSIWQKSGSRIFSFIMRPFLSPFHRRQLKNNPKLFFDTARHPFSVWIGKKLCLK